MGSSPAITDALKVLWVKFLPQMQERVAAMDAANRALLAGPLGEDQRAAATAAAHKLAGVLGTFGLTEGTSLAREAEEIYPAHAVIDASALARLEAIAQQLSEIIQAHG